MEYEQLLDKAMSKVPQKKGTGERFEMPRALVEKAGRRTIIINMADVAAALQRPPEQVIKFLLKELATKGELISGRLFVLGVFTQDLINKKIEMYVKEYVICHECGRPDTKLTKEDRFMVMKCDACGARHTIA